MVRVPIHTPSQSPSLASHMFKSSPLTPCQESHSISLSALSACASFQNFDLRPAAQGGNVQIGDMLFVRSGWTKTYRSLPADERARLALRPHSRETGQSGQQYAGVQQSEEMLDWIHDCYFAAVAGDAPAFEVWPTKECELEDRALVR